MPICKKLVKKGLAAHLLKIWFALPKRICFDCVSFSTKKRQKKLVHEKPPRLRSPESWRQSFPPQCRKRESYSVSACLAKCWQAGNRLRIWGKIDDSKQNQI